MPIYEYYCQACGHELELLQKMSDTPLTTCPQCGKSSLAKLVSSTRFQLKGSGWYVTDFKDSGKPLKKEAPAAAPAATPEGNTSVKPTDKTPPSDSNKA